MFFSTIAVIYAILLNMKALLSYFKYVPLHLVLWVCVWLFFVYFFSYASSNTEFVFWFSITLLPVTIVTTYVFAYLLIPQYLLLKKYVAFTLYGLATFITSLYIILLVNFIILVYLANYQIDNVPMLSRNIVFVLILVYLVVGIVCFTRLLTHSYRSDNKNKELENKMLETELQLKEMELYYLKQQIHPHFLFNTLNTVYGAALKESKDTPALILKLSNMLDYMLHQIDKKEVPISEELKYIESYIGLEQVRFKDTLRVTLEKQMEKDVMVPPMLFMAFVENAFKHGKAINGFLTIDISLKSTESTIDFTVTNTVKENQEKVKGYGLGLDNTSKRLDATFPGAYVLTSEKRANLYELNLTINLKNKQNV